MGSKFDYFNDPERLSKKSAIPGPGAYDVDKIKDTLNKYKTATVTNFEKRSTRFTVKRDKMPGPGEYEPSGEELFDNKVSPKNKGAGFGIGLK